MKRRKFGRQKAVNNERKTQKIKLNQSMNNPNFYTQVTQETCPNGNNLLI